ncbi:MAG: hypothetical protein J6X44_10645 [Thermoguttaceae bacterium]|nr:hypothetical protein [Thermoguttaceae bacterium]
MTQTLFLIAQGVTSISGAIALGALHYYFRSGKKTKSARKKDVSNAPPTVESAAPKSVLFRDQSGDAACALRRALDSVVRERLEETNEMSGARPFEFCVFDD